MGIAAEFIRLMGYYVCQSHDRGVGRGKSESPLIKFLLFFTCAAEMKL